LLVNGGLNHRSGINRNYTEWARTWAALGFTVFRIDIRGLGDSPPDPRAGSQVLYRDATREDLLEAMDFLADRHGVRRFIALGLCSGGYQSLHTALDDARIIGVIMLNPLRFERRSDTDPASRGELAIAPLRHYLHAAVDVGAWKRLIMTRKDPRPIVRSFVARMGQNVVLRARRMIFELSALEAPPATWLSGALLSLVARGARVLIVFNEDDPMALLLDEKVGPDRAALERSGRFSVVMVPDSDHIFTPIVSQERVERTVRRALLEWANVRPPQQVQEGR
ncbi:MAG: alpha/beta fold hydrolase, partial [Polyangiaceae bacterium]|nr:alpha/beta fold hydrolase [Polyangiaceae bacterium]